MINANGEMTGWHPKLFKIHQEATMANQEEAITQKDNPAAAEERFRIEKEASESACAEYLACLFLLLADDGRFKTLKKTLNNNFLLGRQEEPKDVLALKRLMTDFDRDMATGTKHTQEQVQPTDGAFVESGDWEFLICYCCGNKCNKYGWRRCPSSSQKVKDKTTKLVKAGHFLPEKNNTDMDNDNASTETAPPKKAAAKKGATFADVKEESEDKDLPTFEGYLRR